MHGLRSRGASDDQIIDVLGGPGFGYKNPARILGELGSELFHAGVMPGADRLAKLLELRIPRLDEFAQVGAMVFEQSASEWPKDPRECRMRFLSLLTALDEEGDALDTWE